MDEIENLRKSKYDYFGGNYTAFDILREHLRAITEAKSLTSYGVYNIGHRLLNLITSLEKVDLKKQELENKRLGFEDEEYSPLSITEKKALRDSGLIIDAIIRDTQKLSDFALDCLIPDTPEHQALTALGNLSASGNVHGNNKKDFDDTQNEVEVLKKIRGKVATICESLGMRITQPRGKSLMRLAPVVAYCRLNQNRDGEHGGVFHDCFDLGEFFGGFFGLHLE